MGLRWWSGVGLWGIRAPFVAFPFPIDPPLFVDAVLRRVPVQEIMNAIEPVSGALEQPSSIWFCLGFTELLSQFLRLLRRQLDRETLEREGRQGQDAIRQVPVAVQDSADPKSPRLVAGSHRLRILRGSVIEMGPGHRALH
jgi:hypothetical protein